MLQDTALFPPLDEAPFPHTAGLVVDQPLPIFFCAGLRFLNLVSSPAGLVALSIGKVFVHWQMMATACCSLRVPLFVSRIGVYHDIKLSYVKSASYRTRRSLVTILLIHSAEASHLLY